MSSGPASRLTGRETECVTASMTIDAAPEAVFAVLADPSAHAAIDGTGWVRWSMDGDRITAAGQVFRMAMYHDGHPDKEYEIANLVEVFDEPRAIAWRPGTESPETGELSFGGWIWRYDLKATGSSRTAVSLTSRLSAVPPQVREYLQFPPGRTTSTTRCSTCPNSSPRCGCPDQRSPPPGVRGHACLGLGVEAESKFCRLRS